MKISKESKQSIIAAISVIVIMLGIVYIRIIIDAPKKGRIADETSNARIVIDYPKNEDYKYTEIKGEKETGELSQEDRRLHNKHRNRQRIIKTI